MSGSKTLILGGIRSGKSRLAERLAIQSHLPVTYVATAAIEDAEMQTRIALYRANRPNHWHVIEEPLHLGSTLSQLINGNQCLLVDCLTFWMANLLMYEDDTLFENELSAFMSALSLLPGRTILVSSETGMGIMPMDELTGRYCDETGRLHQLIARQCEQVILTVAGLPYYLKGEPDE